MGGLITPYTDKKWLCSAGVCCSFIVLLERRSLPVFCFLSMIDPFYHFFIAPTSITTRDDDPHHRSQPFI
jgi:hypothetical protein